MRGKRATKRWRYGIAGALVLAAVLGAVWLALPRILEGLLVDRLEAAGFSSADLRVADVGWSRATIAGLSLGADDDVSADEVVLTYSPFDLLRGRVDGVRLRGLHLAVRIDGEGAALGGFDAPLAGLGDGGGVPLPDIRVEDGRVTLATPLGIVPVSVAAEIAATSDGAMAGEARIAATLPNLETKAVRARGLALSVALDLSLVEGRLTARLRGGESSIAAQRLSMPGRIAFDGPVRLPLAAEKGPSLAVEFAAPGGPRIAYGLVAGPADLAARLRPEAPAPVPVEAGLRTLSLAGAWTADGGHRIDARLSLAGLARRADPALVAPVDLEADGRLADGRLDFTVRASPAGEPRVSLAAEGRHDFRSGTGTAEIDLPPVALAPGGIAPEDLMPVLKGRMDRASGTVALAGGLSWTAAGVASDLRLLLDDLSFATPQAEIVRLNTVVRLDSLVPPSTPPEQKLAVGLLDVGVPLTDGLVTFRIDPRGKLVVVDGRLRFAGGMVSVRPAVVDFAAATNALELVVSDADLRELLALADIEGLSATGRLDGRIPVRLGEAVVIEGGVLTADGPGRLSYDPARPPAALQAQGETVSLLLSALTDFRYEALRLTVDRDAGGEMVVAIHIEGKNPGFYDGYPVELNFNISGKLDQVLHRGLVGYRIPDVIRDRLSEFPK